MLRFFFYQQIQMYLLEGVLSMASTCTTLQNKMAPQVLYYSMCSQCTTAAMALKCHAASTKFAISRGIFHKWHLNHHFFFHLQRRRERYGHTLSFLELGISIWYENTKVWISLCGYDSKLRTQRKCFQNGHFVKKRRLLSALDGSP